MALIELNEISKEYNSNGVITKALQDIDLKIEQGEMIAIMGPSGSGKSTLLNILGLLDFPTNGSYEYNSINITQSNTKKICKLRNENFSFIFQYFALIKEYSILENVILPLNVRRLTYKYKVNLAKEYLKKLDILDQINKKPAQLSGGQQQRVAIARALIQQSEVILADEPTGALDQKNGNEIMNILKDLSKEGKTIIIVTHDSNVASYCDRVINIQDGRITNDKRGLKIVKY